MKFALSIVALIVAGLMIPFLIPDAGKKAGVDPDVNLPWQVDVDSDGGSRVFGLSPGRSTLAEVRQRWGSDMELAIVAAPDEVGTLEAYFNQLALGFVLAKAIVTVDAGPETITAMRERALKAEHMESTTRKIRLHPEDVARADGMKIRAISIIPSVNLDEATVIQRFGQPDERLAVGEARVHLLYAKLGLDVVVDGKGKELFQYVAPAAFDLLRAPLLKDGAGQ